MAVSGKLRWISTDKGKFRKLTQELSHFASRLNQLFLDTEQGQDQMTSDDLAKVTDIRALHIIRDATDSEDLVKQAVEELCESSPAERFGRFLASLHGR